MVRKVGGGGDREERRECESGGEGGELVSYQESTNPLKLSEKYFGES